MQTRRIRKRIFLRMMMKRSKASHGCVHFLIIASCQSISLQSPVFLYGLEYFFSFYKLNYPFRLQYIRKKTTNTGKTELLVPVCDTETENWEDGNG